MSTTRSNGINYQEAAGAFTDRATEALVPHNERLSASVAATKAAGLPEVAVAPLHGQFLALQCRAINAKSVLEIGALGGYSSTWFASTGAKVTSIEANPKHRKVAMENTKGLDVDIILGKALDVLPKLKEEGRVFDFVFIDADWDNHSEYFRWAVELTRKGGLIYVDNVLRAANVNGQELVESAGEDKRVQASMITTLSGYNRRSGDVFDSFLMAVVL